MDQPGPHADLQGFSARIPTVGLLTLLHKLSFSDPVAARWPFALRTDMRPDDLSIAWNNDTGQGLREYALTETGRMVIFHYANREYRNQNVALTEAVVGSGIAFDGRALLRPVFFFDARGWTGD